MSQTEYRFTNRCENLIVVVVTNVKRQISIDAFERAGTDQTTRATSANALLDGVFREMLDDVSRPAARAAAMTPSPIIRPATRFGALLDPHG